MHGRNMKFLSLSIIGNYCSGELSPAARQPHSRACISDKRRKPACALSSCLAAAITAKFMRKEQKLSPGHGTWLHQAPAETITGKQSERTEQKTGRASFLTSLSRGSLTFEASLVFPLFFFCVIIAMHYSVVMRTAAEFSDGCCEAAQELALAAYKEEYGDSSSLIRGVLSAAWAEKTVKDNSPDWRAVKNINFANSSFMKEGDKITLVMAYRPKPMLNIIPVPYTFFVQKAVVRGWTGRKGSSASDNADGENSDPGKQTVYVTEHGTVYHTDPNCSHIKLDIQTVSRSQVGSMRANDGSKYYPCEHCHGGNGGIVYICPDGNRYHSSPACSELIRSVHETTLEEAAGMHECKDCMKRRLAAGGS